MDLTDTLTAGSEHAAVDGPPLLPTLPPAPVLPLSSRFHFPLDAPIDVPIDVPVSLAAAWISPSPNRPVPAANASYGVMPGKPRAGEPSPAALQAAENRRRLKNRRRIRRVALLVVAIAVVALAGPPAVRWIADGVDKAGSTEEESPSADDTD